MHACDSNFETAVLAQLACSLAQLALAVVIGIKPNMTIMHQPGRHDFQSCKTYIQLVTSSWNFAAMLEEQGTLKSLRGLDAAVSAPEALNCLSFGQQQD